MFQTCDFDMDSRDQTTILLLVRQAVYRLSHLPASLW